MRNLYLFLLIIFILISLFWQCGTVEKETRFTKLRKMIDTVGYAHTSQQMDSLITRISRNYGSEFQIILQLQNVDTQTSWQMVICAAMHEMVTTSREATGTAPAAPLCVDDVRRLV